jgi:hypothetical protein
LVGGFLIDFDHVLFYWIKFKSFNLKRAYNHCRNIPLKRDVNEYKKWIVVFHSFEFMLLIAILSFYHKIFLILLISIVVHVVMDIIYVYPKFKSIEPLSLVWYIKNAKK